ncbi:hypothetical protein GQ43DRAFT_460756 [Delitschia confertaspora ATCC 74209]|uniref:BRCT domain-containing protein n=1 Tax=Delitschia confertaspora ATCC 74209 TaxID=1513339 RepID=A0A9P4JU36_9PLEO|nr:hypothetical protein GQ43DRAFT_460756 [Delitschia confertaspora ATCC 74209]
MESAGTSQEGPVLADEYYDDPSLLSQLLQKRAAQNQTPLENNESQSAHSAVHTLQETPNSGTDTRPSVTSSPRDLTTRRAALPPNHALPRLEKFTTAPTSTGFLKEADTKTMHSYAGPLDAPGDTQPDSQFYRHYTSEIHTSVHNAADNRSESMMVAPTDRTDDNGLSQAQGQSDYRTSPTVLHNEDDELEMEAQAGAEETTSPLKFQTPAMIRRKRDSQGQVVSSAVKTTSTPGTTLSAAFFGVGAMPMTGPTMSLTQVFNNTQVGTSPLVNALPSDPVFQRPSPKFTTGRHSSPPPNISSPSTAIRLSNRRATTEPRDEYITMKESQDLREQEQQNGIRHDTQDSWDQPTEAEKRAAKRRLQEKLEQETRKSYVSITAPSRSSPRSGGRKKTFLISTTPGYQTPAALRTSRRMPASDKPDKLNGADDEDSLDELSQPIDQPVEVSSDSSLSDSDASISHPTLNSVRRKISGRRSISQNLDNKVQVPNTSSHPDKVLSGQSVSNNPPSGPSSQVHHGPHTSQVHSSGLRPNRPPHKRFRRRKIDTVTIADSQPDPMASHGSIMLPPPEIPSTPSKNLYSITQTTMQNKHKFTSQVPSSMPMAPEKSSPVLGNVPEESRVPSSPPPMANVNDIVYDEHEPSEDEQEEDGEDHSPEVIGTVNECDEEEAEERGELPETYEDEAALVHSSYAGGAYEAEEVVQSSPVKKKQSPIRRPVPSAICEFDDVEEHQSEDESVSVPVASMIDNSTAQHQTNSTEEFDTAYTHQDLTTRTIPTSQSSKHDGLQNNDTTKQYRSLTDIANDLDTQRPGSLDMPELEIPDLGFPGDDDEIARLLSGSSPVNPRTKRRRIVYSAKKHFQSPQKAAQMMAAQAVSSPSKLPLFPQPETPLFPNEIHERKSTIPDSEPAIFSTPAVLRTAGKLVRPTKNVLSDPKTRLKPVNKSLIRRRRPSEVEETPSRPLQAVEKQHDVEMTDAIADTNADEAAPTVQSPAHLQNAQQDVGPGEAPSGERLNPNRVFARWPSNLVFYPATCIEHEGDDLYKVRFDDGNTHALEVQHIRALDLRIGDKVKVDLSGMKKNVYVVAGFKDKTAPSVENEFPATDRFGYRTVILEVKARESLPGAKAQDAPQRTAIPVACLYLTPSLWNRMQSRTFEFTSNYPLLSSSAAGTPAAAPSAVVTPSRTGRASLSVSMLKESVNRAASVASSVKPSNIFANMAFAVTFKKEVDKDNATSFILNNGGQVLEEGFHVMFENPTTASFTGAPISPSKSAKGKSKVSTDDNVHLTLKSEYKHLGFVALITDNYYRRPKYIQSLALNIPCLHFRWLLDCLRASTILPFPKYLLPAGISTFLDSDPRTLVVRSRTMTPYDPAGEQARFADVLARRDMLLEGQSVLIVVAKKKDVERKKPYLFLTHALGPKQVGRCADLESARETIQSGEWDWVYVDGDSQDVEDAEAILFGSALVGSGSAKRKSGVGTSFISNASARSKKRKRDLDDGASDAEVMPLMREGVVEGRRVRVMCDEFVVQSLILGALAIEE